MPDPYPQPPQPRTVSPARWLLMLLPSLIVIVSPLTHSLLLRWKVYTSHGVEFAPEFYSAVVSTLLCFYFGFRLAIWRGEGTWDWGLPIGYGFLIFVINAMISFAGCAVTYRL